jgi:hypothetical protein
MHDYFGIGRRREPVPAALKVISQLALVGDFPI